MSYSIFLHINTQLFVTSRKGSKTPCFLSFNGNKYFFASNIDVCTIFNDFFLNYSLLMI